MRVRGFAKEGHCHNSGLEDVEGCKIVWRWQEYLRENRDKNDLCQRSMSVIDVATPGSW